MVATGWGETVTYRRQLLVGWSRRDRLAVLVVAVTVAFLVGSLLLVSAIGTGPIEMVEGGSSPGTATLVEWSEDDATPPETVHLPVVEASRSDGTNVTVVGVPAADTLPERAPWTSLPAPPEGSDQSTAAIGDPPASDRVTLRTSTGTTTFTVTERSGGSLLPADWYVTDTATAASLGPDRALEVTRDETVGVPARGTTLRSVLAFFQSGLDQLRGVLALVLVGSGVLVAVTVAGVTRSTIRDRTRTIGVARATGATPRAVLGVLGMRVALLTGAGTVLGCALGIIATNAAVTVGIALGIPSGLALRLTPALGAQLLGIAGVIWIVGIAAGGVVARRAVNTPPATLLTARSPDHAGGATTIWTWCAGSAVVGWLRQGWARLARWVSSSAPRRARPRIIGWDVLPQVTATLVVFVAVVLVIGSLSVTATPLLASTGTTVTEDGASHPLGSEVPVAHAAAFEAAGYEASPEILGFAVIDGDPVLVRGANYDSFATVTDARLVAGQAPTTSSEAVVGRSVAQRLDVDIGDELVLGGSTDAGVAPVQVTGIYDAPGGYGDHVITPLVTVRPLTNTQPGHAQLIRLDGRLAQPETGADSTVLVREVAIPDCVAANRTLQATVTLQNPGSEPVSRTVEAAFRGTTRTSTTTIPPDELSTVTVAMPSGAIGSGTLQLDHPNGTTETTVRVLDERTPRLLGVPKQVPPGSTPQVTVVALSGAPVANATLSAGNRTVRTDKNGTARLPPLSEGTEQVVVDTHGQNASRTVTVTPTATRTVSAALTVTPQSPSVVTAPTATVRLTNPWNVSLDRTVTIAWPGGDQSTPVQLGPGDTSTVNVTVPRQPPGQYAVSARVDDRELAETTVEVTGDQRLASALAASGHTAPGSGIARGIEMAVGNLYTVLGTMVLLAGLMTAGALVASLSGAIHARRRTIGVLRATGAGPVRVLWLVWRDTARIATVAAIGAGVGATVAVWAAAQSGLLTVYGLDIGGALAIEFVVVAICGAVVVTLGAATVVTGRLLLAPPGALLTAHRSGGDT